MNRAIKTAAARETGSTLIVALVMLLLISLIAVGSMQDTILQERMTSNAADRSIAFESAEAALREGEEDLSEGEPGSAADIDPYDDWDSIDDQTIPLIDDRSAEAPSFHLGEARCLPTADGSCPAEVFRVHSRGVGGRDNTEVLLRSAFLRLQ
jgi:type IV pilus assembly protein PilX